MTHLEEITNRENQVIGDLYQNDDGSSYTAVLSNDETGVEDITEWWRDSKNGSFQVACSIRKFGFKCFLLIAR